MFTSRDRFILLGVYTTDMSKRQNITQITKSDLTAVDKTRIDTALTSLESRIGIAALNGTITNETEKVVRERIIEIQELVYHDIHFPDKEVIAP